MVVVMVTVVIIFVLLLGESEVVMGVSVRVDIYTLLKHLV